MGIKIFTFSRLWKKMNIDYSLNYERLDGINIKNINNSAIIDLNDMIEKAHI